MIDNLVVASYRLLGALPQTTGGGKPSPKPSPGKGTGGGEPAVDVVERGNFHPPPALESKVSTIVGVGAWIVLALCVAGVLLCAAQLAIARKNGAETAVIGLVWTLVACVVAGTASTIVGIVA